MGLTELDREIKTASQRDRERDTQKQKARESAKERDRAKERERETDTDRERQRHRQRETERVSEGKRESDDENDCYPTCFAFVRFHSLLSFIIASTLLLHLFSLFYHPPSLVSIEFLHRVMLFLSA